MNKKKKEKSSSWYGKTLGLIICFTMFFVLSGCGIGKSGNQFQHTGFAMGTVIAQNMYGGDEKMANEILDLLAGLEQTISWRIEGTEVDRINDEAGSGQAVEVSEKLAGWLLDCRKVYEQSSGKLDVTVGPVARLWDIGGENPKVPSEAELLNALTCVDAGKLLVSGKEDGKSDVLFDIKGGLLDLGAVGKGIGCDEIFDYIVTNYPEINGTFSVGGSVLIYGEKPGGQPWKIGIRDPRGEEGEYMGALIFSIKEGEHINVSTSGDYEKYFEEDGVRYHHILDPKTGAPAKSDLISVTIISKSGFLTDALSTACFVAGKEEGLKLADQFGAEAVLITKDKKIFMTDGAEEYFERVSKDYTLDGR